MVWVDWLECWIRSTLCIYVKRRSWTLGRERKDTIIIRNINYILYSTYNDVVVPCNYSDFWEFGPLGLCISLGRQWGLNCAYYNLCSTFEPKGESKYIKGPCLQKATVANSCQML